MKLQIMKLLLGITYCCYLALPPSALLATPQLLTATPNTLDAKSSRAIDELLRPHWARTPANHRESQSAFASAPKDNPHVLVAYVLNRIQHGKIDDALPIATEIRQRFKNNLDGPVLEIWLLALTNQYERAIIRMAALKKHLTDVQANAPVAADVQQKIFSRLGRLMGYFEGPVADKLTPQLIAQIDEQLKIGLAPQTLNAFSLNRTSVKLKYKDLLNDQTKFENAELDRVAAVNEIKRQRLEQDNQIAQQSRERLQPLMDQLTESASSQTSILEQQILSAASELELANQSSFRTEQDLAFLYSDLLRVDRRFRRGYLPNVFALEDQIFRTENQLNQLRNSAVNAASNLAALRNQLSASQVRYGRQIKSLQNQLERSEVAQKRNSRGLEKIARGPKIAGGKKTAIRQRRQALRTYDDLTLELYRQEILDAIN